MSDRIIKLVLVVGLVAIVALLSVMTVQLVGHPGTSSTTTSTTTTTPPDQTKTLPYQTKTPPDQTVAATIPVNDHGGKSTVSVAIPQAIVDKLGPPRDSGLAKIVGQIWPGLAALLAAFAGAVLTYVATMRKTKEDRETAEATRQQGINDRIEAREQGIRDETLRACREVLTAGRLVAMATRKLWVLCANEATREEVEAEFSRLDNVIREWYVAYETFLLRVPPAAKAAFIAYREALNKYLLSATRWRGDYLAGMLPGAAAIPPNRHTAIKCIRLEHRVLAKRETFVETTNEYFREVAQPAT
ncbi:hypothetical protein [Mycolicibacterium sphagni]|uniref:hypothetical protein n=1 Tax=Mycolicibacterium sphagni TaxID=1786 RepID=UPI0021F251D6|nr:hypothetical protein [Mycolicibacterium sphagni]MCV7175451.1 hypothetical protein [Mycolicibacterium sphagni]